MNLYYDWWHSFGRSRFFITNTRGHFHTLIRNSIDNLVYIPRNVSPQIKKIARNSPYMNFFYKCGRSTFKLSCSVKSFKLYSSSPAYSHALMTFVIVGLIHGSIILFVPRLYLNHCWIIAITMFSGTCNHSTELYRWLQSWTVFLIYHLKLWEYIHHKRF